MNHHTVEMELVASLEEKKNLIIKRCVHESVVWRRTQVEGCLLQPPTRRSAMNSGSRTLNHEPSNRLRWRWWRRWNRWSSRRTRPRRTSWRSVHTPPLIYICVCIYLYVYTCIFICIYMYVYIYIYIYVCMYLFIYLYMYLFIYLYMYLYMYIYMYRHIYVYMDICIDL